MPAQHERARACGVRPVPTRVRARHSGGAAWLWRDATPPEPARLCGGRRCARVRRAARLHEPRLPTPRRGGRARVRARPEHKHLHVRAYVESSHPEASADSLSSTPRQRQIKLRAASSLGPPRPIGRYALAGRPYRPCFPHRSAPAAPSELAAAHGAAGARALRFVTLLRDPIARAASSARRCAIHCGSTYLLWLCLRWLY